MAVGGWVSGWVWVVCVCVSLPGILAVPVDIVCLCVSVATALPA